MFRILFGILFFFLILIFLMGALGLGMLRRLFGGGRRKRQFEKKKPDISYTKPQRREKIFDKSDGEYIDFEEIDEEDSL